MTDDRVKLCPHCGCLNLPATYHCEQCGNSLIEVLPIPRDLAIANSNGPNESPPVPLASEDVVTAAQEKRCPHPDCGKSNRPYKLICEHCGRRMDDTSPSAPEAATNTSTRAGARTSPTMSAGVGPRLLLLVGEHCFECRSGDILGRQGTIASEVFLGVDTVSRQHVLVAFHEGQWSLTVLSDKVTQLDGHTLAKGRVVSIDAGEHSLKLSTRCEVRLSVEQCETQVQVESA